MLFLRKRGLLMMSVRWGVVGVGRAGRARVNALRSDPRSTIVGGWRGDPVTAESYMTGYAYVQHTTLARGLPAGTTFQ